MKHWINRHLDTLLFFVSLILITALVLYYVLVIRSVGARLETALNPNAVPMEQTSFDIETAAQLNLKGLRPPPTPTP